MVRHWNKLPKEGPSLEVFKNHGDMALRDMVSGHGGDGLLDDLRVVLFREGGKLQRSL